jgi:acyl-homoserine lactone acylase PvdQ
MAMERRRWWVVLLVAGLGWLSLAVAPAAQAASPIPPTYGLNDAGGFLNVLPAGEGGTDNALQLADYEATGAVPPSFTDELPMYENLVYAAPTLTDPQVGDYFKDATFGIKPQDIVSSESPEPGLWIYRDRYDVPHIYGQTDAEVYFGAGYAGAEDRLFLMDVLRHAAEGKLAQFAGGSVSNREMDETQWGIAPYTTADLQSQINAAPSEYGQLGSQFVQDGQAYIDGINAYIKKIEDPLFTVQLLPSEYVALGALPQPWHLTDLIAEASLIGGIFGLGGGGQVDSALALEALQKRFGKLGGERAWSDFREADDPEAPTTIFSKRFPYEDGPAFSTKGLALPVPGSVTFPAIGTPAAASASRAARRSTGFLSGLGARLVAALRDPTHASNWELVAPRYSADGHSLAVMGPQVGYYVPEILMEEDLHGPDVDASGAAFPGTNLFVELGHGRDYAWSATTSTSDNVSTFAEVLCGDAYHYIYKGQCLPMQTLTDVDSWHPTVANTTPAGTETLTAYRTVHGILYARGRVRIASCKAAAIPARYCPRDHVVGVAFVHDRSTYFHEADSAIGFGQLNDPYDITGPASFQQAASRINFLFNWGYVDANHTSYYMSGWMPQLAKGTSPDFPLLGTGPFDWKGYNPATHEADWLPFGAHPHITNQSYMVSWNNKQAPGWSAADNQWGYGPVYRQQMIAGRIKADISDHHRITIAQVVQAMDLPSTEDIRAGEVLPLLFKVMGKAPSSQLRAAVAELRAWVAAGGFRKGTSASSTHDLYTPAIELMDAWWPKLVAAEFEPALGNAAFDAIQVMLPLGGEAPVSGDGFTDGWWGYVSKDLRRVFGVGRERARYSRAYCGAAPHRRLSARALRRRCRAALWRSLKAALAVTPQQLYGGVCPKDPEPACADANTWTDASAISLPSFPFQNRPTFQQVVTLTRTLPR